MLLHVNLTVADNLITLVDIFIGEPFSMAVSLWTALGCFLLVELFPEDTFTFALDEL